ncbi:MAG: hypothetical protein EZS28_011828, partial [Streblomastix strix]
MRHFVLECVPELRVVQKQYNNDMNALKHSRRLGLASLPEVMHPFTDPPAPIQLCCKQ